MRYRMNTILQNSTQNLKRVLVQAAQLAISEGKDRIEPTHLFYGVTNQIEPFIMGLSLGKKPSAKKGKRAPKNIELSPISKRIVLNAAALANFYNHSYVGTEHLFMSLLESKNQKIVKIVKASRIDAGKIRHQLDLILQSSSKIFDMLETLLPPDLIEQDPGDGQPEEAHHQHKQTTTKSKKVSALDYFTINLSHPDHAQKLDPVIGRSREIERMMHILSRRTKNNPVLLGHPGVGKTAIVEGLAKKIAEGTVPHALRGKRIYSVNLTSLIAGSAFRGELEMRFKQLLEEATNDRNVILFIDEIHNVVGAGASNGSLDVGNILKPALARGDIRCIGATTLNEYKRHIEDDPALERRFQPIIVNQPTIEEAEQILSGLKVYYEQYHGVSIANEAVSASVRLSERYIPEKFLPDKALDVLDETCAKAKLDNSTHQLEAEKKGTLQKIAEIVSRKEYALDQHNLELAHKLHEEEANLRGILTMIEQSQPNITAESIARCVSMTTGIPISQLVENERELLLHLEDRLSQSIIGQTEAKQEVARFIRRSKAGLIRKGRPIASFLFTGPSGVGKTELAKTLSRELFGREGLIKLDMSEFSESFTVSRLIGAPSGYIGYKEGGKLTESVRQRPYSLILFDEIEKAHPKISHLLLQILEDGVLSDASGKQVDFSNTVIILTSNVGGQRLVSSTNIGFATGNTNNPSDVKKTITPDLKEAFSPELLNRIDRILSFSHLTEAEIQLIAKKGLEELTKRLNEHNVTLKWSPGAERLLVQHSVDQSQGARMVRHSLENKIENKLAELLLNRRDDALTAIKITTVKDEFVFTVSAS